jgi:FtsZ-interacting cell division protein YlmF
MVLDGSFAKRLLDFISGGVFGDTEDFVIIAF